MKKRLEDVFVTEGVPLYTFVKPPNYNEILLDIRRPGKPVIIEGQSGTGKTTAVKKILEQLAGDLSIKYYSARKPADVERIVRLSEDRRRGIAVIDDFHRLSPELQSRLADIAKIAAEEGADTELPKLILIGINQVGQSLINLVHDIAKRCGIHRIDPGSTQTISTLIERGCSELNVSIMNRDKIHAEAKGDYWLTQNLCQTVCSMADVIETADDRVEIVFDIESLRRRVVEKLANSYHQPVKEFCRGRRFRTSNDPYYKLLKVVSEQESSIVDLNKIASAHEWVRGSINNIKEKRLANLLENKESLSRYFYYYMESKYFAIEDPALFYYIKHLNWDKLREECGFKSDTKDFEFDIALSFAGENRELARAFSKRLEIFDISVFFDELYESNFLGKALTKEFERIFSQESRFVVCFLDQNHRDKIWPSFERSVFKPRIMDQSIFPVFLDRTIFLGVPEDLYGIDLRESRSEDDLDNATIKLVERLSE